MTESYRVLAWRSAGSSRTVCRIVWEQPGHPPDELCVYPEGAPSPASAWPPQRPQKRLQRRGRVTAAEQLAYPARTQHVQVIDAVSTSDHPGHRCGDLPARVRPHRTARRSRPAISQAGRGGQSYHRHQSAEDARFGSSNGAPAHGDAWPRRRAARMQQSHLGDALPTCDDDGLDNLIVPSQRAFPRSARRAHHKTMSGWERRAAAEIVSRWSLNFLAVITTVRHRAARSALGCLRWPRSAARPEAIVRRQR
jgi:hypothetical protein